MLRTIFVEKFLRLAFCLLSLLIAGNVNAQAAHSLKPPQDFHDPKVIAARKEEIRRNTRFLGWKFSALHPEMSAKWQSLKKPQPGAQAQTTASSATSQSQNPTFPFPGFALLPSLPTGFIPTAAVEGDFNGDGQMDVAISNGGDNTIYVLLGNGDGTFKVPEILYTQGQAPVWITAVSLRNNGHLDLAVADGDSNSVEIFLGNGDGTFQRGAQIPLVNQTPTFILAGDFNNDGKQDLVIGLTIDAGAIQPQFEVLFGDGTGGISGSLLPPPTMGSIDGPVPTGWIASGDLNKDGFLDLVTTITGGEAITYLNRVGASFSQSAGFGPGDGTMVLGLGDMDEDGCLDAVELSGFGFVRIAKGTCDGNFTPGPVITGTGDLDPAIKIVDINGDGHLDVVGSAANLDLEEGLGPEGGYLVSVLKGDGKGNLSAPSVYRGAMDAFSLVVADFTGDNRPEILTVNTSVSKATLFINDGAGNYLAPQGIFIGTLQGGVNLINTSSVVQTVDLNGDGKPDVLLSILGPFGGDPIQLEALLNDGTGKFLPPLLSNVTVGPTLSSAEIAPGLFRNSHTPDVIYVTTEVNVANVVAIVPGNGDGTFGAPVTLETTNEPEQPLKVVTGDFNGDGKLDFVVVGTSTDPVSFHPIWVLDVFLGHGDGTFNHLASQTFPVNNGGILQQLLAVDLNHDGKLDLLLGNDENGGWTNNDDLIEVLGNGDGTFQAPKTLIPMFGPVAVADVNHDGFPDLITWRNPNLLFNLDIDSNIFFAPSVTVYLGTGAGTFVAQPTYNLPGITVPSVFSLLVGDFDGDGNPDIGTIILHTQDGPLINRDLHILHGNGDGTFTVTNHVFQLQGESFPFVGGDFNGDGATDLTELVESTPSLHTIQAASGPPLDITISSKEIVGSTDIATVTLDLPASSSQTVTLFSSDPAVQVPASLNFPAGQQSMSFTFTLGAGFDATHVLALSAKLGNFTATAFAAKPNPNLTTGVVATIVSSIDEPFAAQTVAAGESVSFVYQLQSESGYSGTFSSLACSGLPAGTTCAFASPSISVLPGEVGIVGVTISTTTNAPGGTFPVQVSATDGIFPSSASFQLGIGNYTLTASSTPVLLGPNGENFLALSSTSTNGLAETITLTCAGLPAGAVCANSTLNTNGGSGGTEITTTNVSPADYSFQVVGTTSGATKSASAVLRVGGFTATLNSLAATLSAGQSATFNLTLSSVNHYANQITVSCPPPVANVTCTPSPMVTNLSDGGAPVVTITITASGSSSGTNSARVRPVMGVLFVVLCSVSFFVFAARRKNSFAFAYLVLPLMLGMFSCGGGGSAPVVTNPVPPPQIINVTVTAEANSIQTDRLDQKSAGPIVITIQ